MMCFVACCSWKVFSLLYESDKQRERYQYEISSKCKGQETDAKTEFEKKSTKKTIFTTIAG